MQRPRALNGPRVPVPPVGAPRRPSAAPAPASRVPAARARRSAPRETHRARHAAARRLARPAGARCCSISSVLFMELPRHRVHLRQAAARARSSRQAPGTLDLLLRVLQAVPHPALDLAHGVVPGHGCVQPLGRVADRPLDLALCVFKRPRHSPLGVAHCVVDAAFSCSASPCTDVSAGGCSTGGG